MKPTKIVVAYSGGLDTSVMVRWLADKWNAEIITATGDLGQASELVGLHDKAVKTGAVRAYIKDLKHEFLVEYVWPALKAGALYEGAYPLATALGRPLLAKYLVDIARQEGADTVAHGCTGKGNDQVRFEVTVAALAPDLKCLAPLRDWEFKSRDEEILYAQLKGIPITATVSSPYSIDQNLWGTSIECGVLEDPTVEPPADAYQRTVAPEDAPDKPVYVSIDFLEGVPVALDGQPAEPVDLVTRLNEIGGAHGVGRIDLIENRLVGIKSREIYEAPAATILHFAHTELERLTLEKQTSHTKSHLSADYATLVYNGLWYSPLRAALDAFVNETQKVVSGNVKVKLFKGSMSVASRSSVFSLYNPRLATYTHEDSFDHKASEGFIKIFALPVKQSQQVRRAASQTANTGTAAPAKVPELVS